VRKGWKLVAMALGVLLAAGLVACGEGSGEGASSTAGAAATAPQPSPGERQSGEASIEEFGSEASGSERERILDAFEGYLDAIAIDDAPTACANLSAAVKRSLEQLAKEPLASRGCTAILPKLLSPSAPGLARRQANGMIVKVRAQGGHGFVLFHAPGAELYQLTMVREGGEWKAATVAASVLVPDLSGMTP
jgi:hypothetical protein